MDLTKGIYIRAFKNFKKKYPDIDFESLVDNAIIENDVETFDELDSVVWMNLNLAMQRLIEEKHPSRHWDHSNNEWKRGWLEEIRRTSPRGKFGFGND